MPQACESRVIARKETTMGDLIAEFVMANRLVRRTWFAILVGICLYSGPAWIGLAFVVALFGGIEALDHLRRG